MHSEAAFAFLTHTLHASFSLSTPPLAFSPLIPPPPASQMLHQRLAGGSAAAPSVRMSRHKGRCSRQGVLSSAMKMLQQITGSTGVLDVCWCTVLSTSTCAHEGLLLRGEGIAGKDDGSFCELSNARLTPFQIHPLSPFPKSSLSSRPC